MNKKVVIVICAVLAFFLGAIWMDSSPVIAPLVAFLEVLIGFATGYLFCKEGLMVEINKSVETIQSLLDLNKKLSQENSSLKEVPKSAPKKTRTKKQVEEG